MDDLGVPPFQETSFSDYDYESLAVPSNNEKWFAGNSPISVVSLFWAGARGQQRRSRCIDDPGVVDAIFAAIYGYTRREHARMEPRGHRQPRP